MIEINILTGRFFLFLEVVSPLVATYAVFLVMNKGVSCAGRLKSKKILLLMLNLSLVFYLGKEFSDRIAPMLNLFFYGYSVLYLTPLQFVLLGLLPLLLVVPLYYWICCQYFYDIIGCNKNFFIVYYLTNSVIWLALRLINIYKLHLFLTNTHPGF
jgi:hypothetical protein